MKARMGQDVVSNGRLVQRQGYGYILRHGCLWLLLLERQLALQRRQVFRIHRSQQVLPRSAGQRGAQVAPDCKG